MFVQKTLRTLVKVTSGFSLVELAIVVVIVGVLSAVAVPIYKKNVDKARRTEAMVSIGTIKNHLMVCSSNSDHDGTANICCACYLYVYRSCYNSDIFNVTA